MKIAITGTNSGLGKSLAHYFESKHEIVSFSRPKFDLDNIHCLENIDLLGVDILINNAGHSLGGGLGFLNHEFKNWNSIIQTNLLAPIYLTQKFLRQNSSGKIIFITSRSVEHNIAGDSVYSASKSGLSTFIDCLRQELDSNYQLIELRPGRINTSFAANRKIHDASTVDTFYQSRPHLTCDDMVKTIEFAINNSGLEKITISNNK